MTSAAERFATGLAFAALIGCSSNHDLLAQRPDQPGSNGGDAAQGDESFPVVPGDASQAVDAGDPEPPGPWVLTMMNGVVDVGSVRFCFLPVIDGREGEPDPSPVPAAPGLPFGAHVALSKLAGIDFKTTDVHPYLVTGADAASAALSCRQIPRPAPATVDADASDARADVASQADAAARADAASLADVDSGSLNPGAYFSLPIIPAGTLGDDRSYLAVATGCAHAVPVPDAGNADADDLDAGDEEVGPNGEAAVDNGACGTGFGPTTLGLSLVRLSRLTNFSKMGFQTVNASNAASPASLLIEQANTKLTVFLADSVALGQITPRAQPTYVATADLGLVPRAATFHVAPPAGSASFPEFQTDLATILLANGLTESILVGATNFTFVLVGAKPGRPPASNESPFAIELVENAPSGPDAGADSAR